MGRQYLVTGGSGFIGAAAVCRLIRDGHTVRVLDDNSRGHPRRLAGVNGQLEFCAGDVRDREVVTAAACGCDAVLHLAAVNGTEFFYSRPEQVLDVALRGILAVIDACRANGIGDLVVASSSEVYQTPPVVPTPETVPLAIPDVLNPRYSYAGGKLVTELVAVNYGRSSFDRVAIFRPHNVYGPDMGFEHVLPQLAMKAATAAEQHKTGPLPLPIQGEGTHTRAFIHIDDFTDGLMLVLEKGEHLGLYHIGSEEEVTIADVAHRIVACLGREAALERQPQPAGGTPRRCPDIGRLRGLGFKPGKSLDQGLPGLVHWYAANRHLCPGA